MASNFNQQSNYGGQHPTHPVGSQIAANQGAVMYEDETPGASLSGGANPTTGHSIHKNVNGGQPATQQFQGTAPANSLGASSPQVTDVGINTGGQNLVDQVKQANTQFHQPTGQAYGSTSASSAQPGVSGTGITSHNNPASQVGGSQTGVTSQTDGSSTLYDQAARGAQVAGVKAQEVAEPVQPYIQKVQETVTPYVQNAVDTAGPYVQQAREVASPYVEKASALASQGIQATAAELDKRGVNMDTIQQKTADVSQTLKDYSAVGQQRAGEYFQQAVDQAHTLRADGENRNIVATIFGTIALIWLAFGFSITALLALGIAGGLAAILSRYSRAAVGTRGQPPISSSTASKPANPSGVETHYPNRGHPDNSLNN